VRDGERGDDIFRRAVEAGFGFVVIDHHARVVAANAPVCDLLGRAEETLVERPLAELAHPDDRGWIESGLDRLRGGASDRLRQEVRLLGGAGETVWAELNVHPVALDGAVWAVAMVEDARDRLARERELRRLADTDPLTDLFNRRRFEAELQRHLARARRYGAAGALLLIDIDGLKRINDERGHLSGDRAIIETAGVLRRKLRATDVVARIGGDEFAVLLPSASAADAWAVAESVIVAGRRHPRNQGCVTVSIGIAAIESSPLDARALFERADRAMYAVKRGGGDGCAVHPARLAVGAESP